MRTSPVAVAAGIAMALGFVLAGWAWAAETLLSERGKSQISLDYGAAAALIITGLLVLILERRLSLIDLVGSVVLMALAGNAALWLGDAGALDCMLGKKTAPPAPELVRVAFATDIVELGAPTISNNAAVRVVVVARHHNANDEEEVETTTYDASYIGVEGSQTVVSMERGEDDADAAAFLAALADAERIAIFLPPAESPASPASCG